MRTIDKKSFSLVLLLMILLVQIQAQEFGRNKVQYEKFDWHYLQSQHFDIYFAAKNQKLAEFAADQGESAYVDLSHELQHKLRKRVPILVYGSHGQFEQTNVILQALPEGIGGFTEIYKNRVVLPFLGSYDDFRHVLHHELTHAMVFDLMYGNLGAMVMRSQFNVPLWVHEGLSEYNSLGWDLEADAFMIDAAANGILPRFDRDFGGFLVYKAGQSFFNFLAYRYGRESIGRFLHKITRSREFAKAFEKAFGEKLEEAGKQWIAFVKRSYWPELGKRDPLDAVGKAITSQPKDLSRFNLQPCLSPDGKRIAYFSDRKDYTDIYIYDIEQEKTIARIASQSQTIHIETFHPSHSGISWSSDGKELLLITRSRGKEYLTVFDVATKKQLRKIHVPVETASSPDWSSDGEWVVFSGIQNAQTDLYQMHLSSRKLQRLTDDLACDRNPTYSPDGKTIVFDSNPKGNGTAQQLLKRASYDIYQINQDGMEKKKLTHNPFDDEHPTWSPDGKHLIFTSNRNGLENLYLMPINSLGSEKPITDVLGSCQTPYWSRKSDRIVFAVFASGGWNVYLMENPQRHQKQKPLAPTRFVACLLDTTQSFFPPPKAETSLDSLAADSVSKDAAITTTDSTSTFDNLTKPSPLPTPKADTVDLVKLAEKEDTAIFFQDSLQYKTNDGAYLTHSYRLKFSPDLVFFGIMASTYYGGAAQGAVLFSDILGNHRIAIAGDIYQTSFSSDESPGVTNVLVQHLYLKHRINTQALLFFSRNPYDDSWWTEDNDSLMIETVFLDQNYGGGLSLEYPISTISRIDFSLLLYRIERSRYWYQRNRLWEIDGEYVAFSERRLQQVTDAEAHTVFQPEAGFVHDNILWGVTGPVNGSRYRLDVGCAPGFFDKSYAYAFATFDARKYFHLRKKYNIAVRLTGGTSEQLYDTSQTLSFKLGGDHNWLFFPSLNPDNFGNSVADAYFSKIVVPLRGYRYGDFAGTKFVLTNLEFRYPFIQKLAFAWPLPLEISNVRGALFCDLGSAWSHSASWRPTKWDDQYGFGLDDLKAGTGLGLRMNLGFVVLRIDRAWPTDFSHIGDPTNYFSLGAEF